MAETNLSESVKDVLAQFEKDKASHLKDLEDLVRIPSVSFPGYDMKDVQDCGEKVAEIARRIGLENVELLYGENQERPFVYGDWLHAGEDRPTLLLYAHHDVQPPGDEAKWESPVFEPTTRNGRMYGRGSADDKAGVVIHTATIESWMKSQGKLPVNVKIIFEGEEEVGSPGLGSFLKKHQEKLKADILILTDTFNYSIDRPGLTVGLRGMVGVEVEVKGLRQSVHSGMLGGPLPDPAIALCQMLGGLMDEEGKLNIPSLWKQVRPMTDSQTEMMGSLKVDPEEFRHNSGLVESADFVGGGDTGLWEKVWFRPSVSINAIQAGDREQAGNIICESAWAKVSIRTVPDMDPDFVLEELTNFIKERRPHGLEVSVKSIAKGDWWVTETNKKAFDVMIESMTEVWGESPVLMGCGGTIPFVEPFVSALDGAPALLVGVEDPATNAHSENESLHLGVWERSVKTCIDFFGRI